MRIAVDAMGGDRAPHDPVAGVAASVREDHTQVLLVGDQDAVRAELAKHRLAPAAAARIEVVHAPEVVGMEESAITPIRKKRRSSMRIAAELVRDGQAQALVSAGNTGALMISAKLVIGAASGVDRPALAATLPTLLGHTVLLDVGANVDSKAEHLEQFAVMGHFYAQVALGLAAPRVGLMSIGEEEGKGSDTTREVFRSLASRGLNFIGNVEGSDLFKGTADVIVGDCFVGNALLKSSESLGAMVSKMLREEFTRSVFSVAGYFFARPARYRFSRRVDYSEDGGAPLLGLNAGCFIAHGKSDGKAIKNAIRRAVEFCAAHTAENIRDKLNELAAQAAPAPSGAVTP